MLFQHLATLPSPHVHLLWIFRGKQATKLCLVTEMDFDCIDGDMAVALWPFKSKRYVRTDKAISTTTHS